jgi:hypothetical protein
MPPCQHPVAPHLNGIRVVTEVQSADGGSPNGSHARDAQATIDPLEMLGPCLFTRVEQRDERASLWIERVRLVALMTIADRAG